MSPYFEWDESSPIPEDRRLSEAEVRELLKQKAKRGETITESTPSTALGRENLSDTDLSVCCKNLKRSYGFNSAETILMRHEPVDSYGFSESDFREGWKQFSDILTESEINGLVRGRIAAPKRGNR
jgi:hypothetical protein